MGKHKKLLKSEKAKVKLRTKKDKDKLLSKGLNITNVAFKSKKINIQEQLKTADSSTILSRRKLDVKALLKRLEHHNTKSRLESLKELKEILIQHTPDSVISPLHPLLRGVLSLTLDIERNVRREAIKVFQLIVSQIPSEKFLYSDLIVPYLGCTMTHVNTNIREDSLLILDAIVKNCNQIIVENHARIIPNLMDLISKLYSDAHNRVLSSNLSAKIINIKWITKILLSLSTIFESIVSNEKATCFNSDSNDVVIIDNDDIFYIPVYANKNLIEPYSVNFNFMDCKKNNFSQEIFSHINQLLPLIFDSWVEVSTKDNFDKNNLRNDEVELLQSIIMIFKSIINYIDILDKKNKSILSEINVDQEFKNKFQVNFINKIFDNLPYFKRAEEDWSRRKRQNDNFINLPVNGCDLQNLELCYIYVWFTKIKHNENKPFSSINKKVSKNLIEYIIGKLKSWSKLDSLTRVQLANILKTLFLEAHEVWYKNKLPLDNILQSALEVYLKTSNEDIFNLFENIAMNHTLTILHSNDIFQKFVENLLPKLLLCTISDNTIKLLNNIVMRKLEWVREFLSENKSSIIENAKTIEVTGSKNVHESRLMLCNLLYFTDRMVYY